LSHRFAYGEIEGIGGEGDILVGAFSGRRYSYWLGLAVIAVLAVALLDQVVPRLTSLHRHRPVVASNGAPQDYAAALRNIDLIVEGDRALANGRSNEWLIEEKLANAYIGRARLTGSFDDYAAAQAALDRAMATAAPGIGPHLTQAVLAFNLHRLAQTGAALDAIDHYSVMGQHEVHDEAVAMRGDLAFYRGRYAEALRLYRQGQGFTEGSFRMAVYLSRTGAPDEALAAISSMEAGIRFPTAQVLSNLALLRGSIEMQRGEWSKATEYFRRADAIFPGSWLIQAHLAQMLAMSGKREQAARQYEAIARRSGVPEVMDALAGLYRAQGDAARATFWADQAGQIWARRLGQLPEAAYGHAVEHELAFGNPDRALQLAQLDEKARPYGVTAIALAWAYIGVNRPADALRVIDPVLQSAWVSADQHIVAAQAHLLLGQTEDADAERQKALAINPRSFDREAALIWFGH
jgi:tetratricopeptide (TPR) repeat protein